MTRDAEPAATRGSSLSGLDVSATYARQWSRFCQLWWLRIAGLPAVAAARQARFTALVRFARQHSSLYRDAYRSLPASVSAPALLPVMTKQQLMARFEDWVTDTAIHRADIDAFLADRTRIGERYLGRYVVWKSSGTTGEPGIYVQDDDALAVYDALVAVQLATTDLGGRCAAGLLGGGRAALIAATSDHFASIVSWQRACRSPPGLAARNFSIMEPLARLVAELNAYAPAFLASYPTLLALLAEERLAGRLHIGPALIWTGGEFLAPGARADLERVFGCPVLNEYGSSECMSIAFGCGEGWLHVNSDWVLLEPVDADHRPTPPGQTSHTVLLTNLANRVQPIIRYDLGDAVIANPGPCRCGNPLPAIRVEGRREDIVTMTDPDGHGIRVLPMALTTLIEEVSGVHRFQVVQTRSDTLLLRLDVEGVDRRNAVFRPVARALRDYLVRQGVADAHIALDKRPPVPDRRSGKLHQVVVELKPAAPGSTPERLHARSSSPPAGPR